MKSMTENRLLVHPAGWRKRGRPKIAQTQVMAQTMREWELVDWSYEGRIEGRAAKKGAGRCLRHCKIW